MRGVFDFDARLDNMVKRENLGSIIDAARELVANPFRPFLLIAGGVGNGKTHICQAVTRELNVSGIKTNYYSVKDLIDKLKGAIEDKLIDQYRTAVEMLPGLVLDDYGANRGTEWELAELEGIIDFRYRKKLVTLMTTNLDPAIRPFSQRIYSRFMDGEIGRVFFNRAPDYRVVGG